MYKKNYLPYLFLIPIFLYVLLFILFPLFETIFKSFYQIDGLGYIKRFVGIDNFIKVLTDSEFLIAITNSFIYMAITVPISKIFGLLFAIIARKKTATSFIYETLFSIPIAVATPTICMIFALIYSPNIGLLNNLLDTKIQWLRNPSIALVSISFIGIWISTGYAFIYLLPAIRNIPKSVLDSAEIDELNFLQRIKYIYYPFLSPTFYYLLIVDIPTSLMMMSIPNILTEGGPNNSTMTIMLYIYRQIASVGNYTIANAATLVAILIMAIVLYILFKLEKKIVFYNN